LNFEETIEGIPLLFFLTTRIVYSTMLVVTIYLQSPSSFEVTL
jgi:hypothetical protein